jgi:fumarylpyruvate hydrolase
MADQLVFPGIEPTVLPVAGGGLYPVRRIYCVGRNYVSHVREMKEADERDPPFFFQKPRDAIGKDGRDIDIANALDHIWGYAVGIELTSRDRQRDARDLQLPWDAGKSFDHSAPCRSIHPASGAITLSVNGTEQQRGDLKEMIWNVPEIVAQLSSQMTLKVGDLIMTGTPAGVCPVVPGDVMLGAVEGLGTLTVTVGDKAR